MHNHLSPHQIDAYLLRIGLKEPPEANLQGLKSLHRAQFFHIPFENLNIRLGRGVSLDPETVFEKLVTDRRGGYCFELNGLMLRALRSFGFDARALLARVHLGDEPSGKTHQLNLVHLPEGDWTIDVGFGAGGPQFVLPLSEGTFTDERASYRLSMEAPWGWMMRTLDDGTWKDSYSFSTAHVTAADIEMGNHYTSTSPNSHFTQISTVSLPTASGRISLRDLQWTEWAGDRKTTRMLEPIEFVQVLDHRFGINIPHPPPFSQS
ncbi:MAG: arylamine N-acetyltransferase [Acidobacteria bacterium]|nr:arylamine N-acetyltransferase [Acidobacteriota bacterium]